MSPWVAGVLGFVLGTFFGVFVIALCVGSSDDRHPRTNEGGVDDGG